MPYGSPARTGRQENAMDPATNGMTGDRLPAAAADTRAALRSIATLGQLFDWRVAQTPDAVAYRQFDHPGGVWLDTTWRQLAERVLRWRRAIATLQLDAGARVGILLPNGVGAVGADAAVLALGLVPVPMHALDNPASIRYILDDCQVALLLTETQQQWRAIASCGPVPEHLRLVVTLQDDGQAGAAPGTPALVSMDAWLSGDGQPLPTPRVVAGTDLAAIVYTSGTTGKPKGVMLSHANILANLRAVFERVPVRPDDVFLSVLPLSHTFERTIGYYLPMAAGASVAYARSVALLAEDLATVRPTVLVGVPRIFEKFHAAVLDKVATGSRPRRLVYRLALAVGWRRFCRRQHLAGATGGLALTDALLWPALDRLVARTVRARFGGRLRVCISGGAPLPAAAAQGLLAMQLPLLQGYGMTECAPVVAANSLADNWPATVGRALEGTQVRLGERGELQVRSPSVMLGYWGRPDDTRLVLDADGWLSTGDQAVIDDGRLRIVGRLKDILVTSTGEKIAAGDVEQAMLADPLFAQVMALGDNRPFIGALVVLNRLHWRALALRLALNPDLPASVDAPAARAAMLKAARDCCAALPHYAMPRALCVVLEPWTVENSFLTPTLKLKRGNLTHAYADQVAAMYGVGPTGQQRPAAAEVSLANVAAR
jgi:long-chain acyl-CoA synthetase